MNGEVGRGAERLRARWVPERKLRYYRVLGLEPGVSLEELKQTHKDLVKVWHPDRFADDPRLQQKAQEKLKEINEAYEQVLSDAFPTPRLTPPVPDSPPAVQPEGRPAQASAGVGRYPPGPFGPFQTPPPPQAPLKRLRFLRNPFRSATGLGVVGLGALLLTLSLVLNNNDDSRRRDAVGANEASSSEKANDKPAGEYLPPSGPAFGLGSTKDEVLMIQGTPTSVEGNRWMYELSSIDFSDGKVESYANISRNLHVRLRPAGDSSAGRSRGYFTLGSSPDEVLGVQGTPTSVEGRRWRYESSSVDFSEGKVESYANASRNLHVQISPVSDPSAAHSRGYFTLGSSPDEVLAVQGTPTSVEGSRWSYESSSVEFSDSKLESYSNVAGILHVQVFPAGDLSAARLRGYFTLGSSQDEVLAVQGTPTSIEGNRWTYELSWIKFDMGKVESYSNFSGNLRLRVR